MLESNNACCNKSNVNLKKKENVLIRSISTFCILVVLLSFSSKVFSQSKKDSTDVKTDTTKVKPTFYYQDRYGDPLSIRNSRSPLLLPLPSLIKFDMKVDTSMRYFNLTERLGDFDYRYPSIINMNSYQKYRYQELMTSNWRGGVNPADTATTDDPNAIIPPIELKGKAFKRLFGGDKITLQPNGNIVLDFGGLWQRVDNPELSVRQQRQGGFNFDQQIGMNLAGKIGEKLNVNFNFDTKNTFQFEQAYNISYTAFEEDIIQEVQLGNVNFPVNNSLISGAQNLFGIKTRLRFGKLWVNSVISNQRGTVETIRIKNGAQSREFEIRSTEYDYNRHFFLSQFFRDNYENSLINLPVVNSGVNISRVVVYVTNRNNNTSDLRNMVGVLDLGDIITDRTVGVTPKTANSSGRLTITSNENLSIDGQSLSGLLSSNPIALRDANAVENALTSRGLENGSDFVRLDNARQLSANEYTINRELGYISLNTPLRNDEALAVAFEYTYNGVPYRVGELQEDIQRLNDEDVIYLKLLRPASIQTSSIAWDLMMKNVYSLNTNQLQRDGFQCRVIYRDDNTGLDQPKLQEGQNLKNQQLVKVMGIDQLNPNRDRQSDGNADFVEGITIDPLNGRVIFPTLEPFRSQLEENFLVNEQDLKDKYVFNDLYLRTQADARLNRTQNKYFLKGSYRSGSSTEIILPGINIAQNSVVVRAGNTVLSEGSDYTVDYQFGRVRLMNQGVLSSGKEIIIQYERADLFALQTRNLMGVDLEYIFNKDVRFTGTLLHFNERPVLTRVAIGNEPVKNTVFGFGLDYRGESNLLTKIANKIPGVKSKDSTPITLKAEVAGLIPGAPKLIGENGVSYIDDFESSEVPYDLTRSPQSWVLGSTPQLILDRDNVTSGSKGLEVGYRRAKLAWYNIDQVFYRNDGVGNNSRPGFITDEDVQNQYVRAVGFNEVFPNKSATQIPVPEVSFDLAYYPDERGPYNYNDDPAAWETDGKLQDPEKNFGAITRAITHDVDFDNINIQYIEFWMMDPFMSGPNNVVRDGESNTSGGDLYINLGNVSEDVIPDDRHFFENGLTVDRANLTSSEWGYSPNQQYLTNAFSTEDATRTAQDVGFDGFNNLEETDSLLTKLPANVQSTFANDPSSDDFVHYFDADFADNSVKVLDLYKNYNNPQGNSPANTSDGIVRAYSNLPENEDLNKDNTLSTIDQYYQYRVPMRPGMDIGSPFIVDKLETQSEFGDDVTWYQFRVPIRTENKENIGGIDGFKSIRYIRMFMTGWKEPVVLRMVQFQFVSAQWRPVTEFSVAESGAGPTVEPPRSFDISSVNIEENGDISDGTIPYDLPPGFIRDFDQTSAVTRQLNEQSLQICVDGLEDGDGRAAFKTVSMDFINYKRLKLEVHGHSAISDTDDMNVFLRLGTDEKSNYYEIEWPLEMTALGQASYSREEIWPSSNSLDIAFEDLLRLKAERNKGTNLLNPRSEPFTFGKYKIRIVGNPDISNVQNALIGVRNPQNDGRAHSACIWVNELRVTDFDNRAGYAANVQLNTSLGDFASINASVKYTTVGYGSIQDRVSDRNRYDNLYYDLSSQINLDRLGLDKLGISLPLFVSLERDVITPQFDPLNPDTELSESADRFSDNELRRDYINQVQTVSRRRSINLTNVRKKKLKKDAKSNIWDIENFTFNASYSDELLRDAQTDEFSRKQWSVGGVYNFSSSAEPWEPFKKRKWRSKYMTFLKDFNLQPMPTNVTVMGRLDRSFMKTQLRNSDLSTEGIDPFFEKSFTFTRDYASQWNLTQTLNLDYRASAYAIIDEPAGEINEVAKDSILTNLKNLGRIKSFSQGINGTYRLPFDKFPITEWLGADTRYSSTYTWNAGPEGLVDSVGNDVQVGNTIQNIQDMSINGKIDLQKIYKKVPFLTRIDKLKRGKKLSKADDPYEIKRKKLTKKIADIDYKLKKRADREKKKAEKAKKKADEAADKTEKEEEKPKEDDPKEDDPKEEEKKGDKEEEEEELSKLERKRAELEEELKALQEVIKQRKKDGLKAPEPSKSAVAVVGTLMSIKDVNFSYSQNSSTTLPGFSPTPRFLGYDSDWEAPGASFLLGSQNPDLLNKAVQNGWLAQTDLQNQPFVQTRQRQLSIKTQLEPIKDFKVTLEASWSNNASYSEIRRWNNDTGAFETQSSVRNGGFTTSFLSLPTAFKSDRADNTSEVFDQFETNLGIIKDRLDPLLNLGDTVAFDTTSQDVMIPAFLAAYTGKDANSVDLSPVRRSLPIPNWQVTYNGLGKIKSLKKKFKSISITHGYRSEYSTGSYTSSLIYVDPTNPFDLTFNLDEGVIPYGDYRNDNGFAGGLVPVPVLIYNDVSISEQFTPLIGVNIRTKKDMSFKIDYKKRRDVGLNLSNAQITETKNNDITIDVGFTKKGMKIPLGRKSKVLKNDVTFRMAFTLQDSKTVQRKIADLPIVTNGTTNLRFRPTINYEINKRTQFQWYFERTITSPRVSNSFKRTTTAFGFQLRFNLAQ